MLPKLKARTAPKNTLASNWNINTPSADQDVRVAEFPDASAAGGQARHSGADLQNETNASGHEGGHAAGAFAAKPLGPHLRASV